MRFINFFLIHDGCWIKLFYSTQCHNFILTPSAVINYFSLDMNFFNRIPCSTLFEEAIYSARTYYSNQHVYPYTYQGGYFYRNKMYKEAFESWANASDVIRL